MIRIDLSSTQSSVSGTQTGSGAMWGGVSVDLQAKGTCFQQFSCSNSRGSKLQIKDGQWSSGFVKVKKVKVVSVCVWTGRNCRAANKRTITSSRPSRLPLTPLGVTFSPVGFVVAGKVVAGSMSLETNQPAR